MESEIDNGGLNTLTEEGKEKAFQRVDLTKLIPNGNIVRVTPPYYQDAIAMVKCSFTKDEPLCSSCDMSWDNEVEAWWIQILQQNLSLMVYDKDSGEPMGLACVEVPQQTFKTVLNNNALNHIFAFLDMCDTNANFPKHFPDHEVIHLLAGSVSRKYREKGIATKLLQAVIAMAKEYASTKTALKAECTSNYTKIMLEHVGFECLYEKSYATYLVDGDVFFKNTGEHKSLKILARKLHV